MRLLEVIKRFAPFLLTFALGLFIASFFVSIAPNFQFKNRAVKRHHECKRIKWDNKRLQERVEYLERRNARLERENLNHNHEFDFSVDVPPPPPVAPLAPPPPPAPVAPRSIR